MKDMMENIEALANEVYELYDIGVRKFQVYNKQGIYTINNSETEGCIPIMSFDFSNIKWDKDELELFLGAAIEGNGTKNYNITKLGKLL